MVGLNYDGDAWVIIGTGRYVVFINDHFPHYHTEKGCLMAPVNLALNYVTTDDVTKMSPPDDPGCLECSYLAR